MANPRHLAKLKEGVEDWNLWRRGTGNSPGHRYIDLSGADLQGLKLREVDLCGANLQTADMSGTNLECARLRHANLIYTDFSCACLSGADLAHARLMGAKLDFTELRQVQFEGTDFTAAKLYQTLLLNVDLSGAKGLEACRHKGPSTVDHETLTRSGLLPLSFLRGCGLPDKFIEYIPSIFKDSPIQFYSCFISYASRDEEFAKRLHADLQDNGVRCWFAPEDMKTGALIHDTIDRTIRVHDKLLLILSETSVASAWVTREVKTALEEEGKHSKTVLFPVRLDDAVMDTTEQWAHDIRRQRHVGDFTSWRDHGSYKKAFDRLLRDLRVEGSGEGG